MFLRGEVGPWEGDVRGFLPWDDGGAAMVFRAVVHGAVVGAGEVVVGEGFEVEGAVVAVGGAKVPGRLVEGVGDEEVRPGQDPILRALSERRRAIGVAHDRAVLLGVHLVPMLRREASVGEVGEATGVGGELGEDAGELAGMNGGEAGAEGRGPRLVIELGEHRQLLDPDTHDAVGMAHGVPCAGRGLVPAYHAGPVVGKAGIDRRGQEQVREVMECWGCLDGAVDVDAVLGVVVHLRKELGFVGELKMSTEPSVEGSRRVPPLGSS